jgi:pyruvate,water dikinase
LDTIPLRRKTYKLYADLPPYPVVINGHFNPWTWAKDPYRRSDFFDSHASVVIPVDNKILKGFPGSAGIVEGRVRLITSFEEGAMLQPGEILVTATTNIGWTPLFPRVVAIITDVGAPLSHSAIVARELGIPAVVGCSNASNRLRTGDWVRVNGSLGLVEIIEPILDND